MLTMAYFAPYVDGNGIHMPTYEERLENLTESYRSIFGIEAELSPAVPDYQLLSVFAKALDDVSALVLQAYNSRNPQYAAGQALDLLLPQYGLVREQGESDASVRNRIASSLAGRGINSSDAVLAAVKAAKNVRHAALFSNEEDSTDARGIPGHSIAVVIEGGNSAAVAEAIFNKKAPGIGTFGSTSVDVTDVWGRVHSVSFSRTTDVQVSLSLLVRRLSGCDEAAVSAALKSAMAGYINGLEINEALIIPRLYAVAYAADPALSPTFAVADIVATYTGGGSATRDEVPCAWNEFLFATEETITVTFRD